MQELYQPSELAYKEPTNKECKTVSPHTDMTFPRADRDLLMLAPSFSRSPVAPVLSALSDPAGKHMTAYDYVILQNMLTLHEVQTICLTAVKVQQDDTMVTVIHSVHLSRLLLSQMPNTPITRLSENMLFQQKLFKFLF